MADGAPTSGGHAFRSSFDSDSTAAPTAVPPRRKKRRGLLLAAGGVVVLALACGGIQLGANLGYDDALAEFETAAQSADDRQGVLDRELNDLNDVQSHGSKVADAAGESLMDSTLREELVAAIADAETVATDAAQLQEENVSAAADKPVWAWELFGETTELNSDREDTEQLVEDLESVTRDTSDASAAVEETGVSAVLTAAEASDAFEAAHVSARNLDIIALRDAAESLEGAEALDEATSTAYVSLETAAAQMLTSEQTELEEKSGPLRDARVEIEAFARSIAPGVLLDFDWSERVNGYGYGDSMGGYATWWYSDPGYATIELSNSVAAHWPSDRSKALVAHEVGHTMSVKCQDMYDDSTQENIEAWATAWAISMGYHNDANGTWAYGAPPQSLIDTAAGCR